MYGRGLWMWDAVWVALDRVLSISMLFCLVVGGVDVGSLDSGYWILVIVGPIFSLWGGVRVGMLIGCVSWPSFVMLGVWLHCGSLGKRFCLDYLVITGALRRWSTVTELCKGTPSVASI